MANFRTAHYRPERPVSFSPLRDSGWAYLRSEHKTQEDDTTYGEVFVALEKLVAQKKQQSLALADVVSHEAAIVKKAVFVAVAGAVLASGFCLVLWAIINVFAGIALDRAGLHLALNALILLATNGVLLALCLLCLKQTYPHITFMPIVRLLTGSASRAARKNETESA